MKTWQKIILETSRSKKLTLTMKMKSKLAISNDKNNEFVPNEKEQVDCFEL